MNRRVLHQRRHDVLLARQLANTHVMVHRRRLRVNSFQLNTAERRYIWYVDKVLRETLTILVSLNNGPVEILLERREVPKMPLNRRHLEFDYLLVALGRVIIRQA